MTNKNVSTHCHTFVGWEIMLCSALVLRFLEGENFLVLSFKSSNWDELFFCSNGNLSTQMAGNFLGSKGEKEALSLYVAQNS